MFLPLGTEEGYVDAVLKKCGNPIQAGVDEVFKKGFAGFRMVGGRLDWTSQSSRKSSLV